jgi:hypothetical protein
VTVPWTLTGHSSIPTVSLSARRFSWSFFQVLGMNAPQDAQQLGINRLTHYPSINFWSLRTLVRTQYPFCCHPSRSSSPPFYRIPPMVLVGPPGPVCGALIEDPTALESLEQPTKSTRGRKSRNIRTAGSFFCNMPFVRNMTDEWLYCSDVSHSIERLPTKPYVTSGWRLRPQAVRRDTL